ncbi:MAG: helix-turn-helix transcriptional regulator [Evtepia sp.]
MKFGDILSELRHDKNLLQKDIANLIHVSVSTVSNYETGAHFPDIQTIMKLADFFQVPIDYLLGRTKFYHNYDILNQLLKNNLTVADLMNTILTLDDKDIASLIEYLELLKLRSKY